MALFDEISAGSTASDIRLGYSQDPGNFIGRSQWVRLVLRGKTYAIQRAVYDCAWAGYAKSGAIVDKEKRFIRYNGDKRETLLRHLRSMSPTGIATLYSLRNLNKVVYTDCSAFATVCMEISTGVKWPKEYSPVTAWFEATTDGVYGDYFWRFNIENSEKADEFQFEQGDIIVTRSAGSMSGHAMIFIGWSGELTTTSISQRVRLGTVTNVVMRVGEQHSIVTGVISNQDSK